MKGKLIEVLGLKAEAGDVEIMDLDYPRPPVNADFLDDLGELLSLKTHPLRHQGRCPGPEGLADVIARLQGEVEQLKAERASEKAEKNLSWPWTGRENHPGPCGNGP